KCVERADRSGLCLPACSPSFPSLGSIIRSLSLLPRYLGRLPSDGASRSSPMSRFLRDCWAAYFSEFDRSLVDRFRGAKSWSSCPAHLSLVRPPSMRDLRLYLRVMTLSSCFTARHLACRPSATALNSGNRT